MANFTVEFVDPRDNGVHFSLRYRDSDSYRVLPNGALEVESSSHGVTRVVYAPTAWVTVTEEAIPDTAARRRRRATDV